METIQSLNQRLLDRYGRFADTNYPNFRLVLAGEQLERVHAVFRDFTSEGIFIREVEETREIPKYTNIKPDIYVLEAPMVVPSFQQTTLVTKLSFECVWAFRDKEGKAIYPVWRALEFLVDTILGNAQKHYTIERETPEMRQKRLDEIYEELYGGISKVEDAFATGRAVSLNTDNKMVH